MTNLSINALVRSADGKAKLGEYRPLMMASGRG
jgi:hypothetical protein